MDGVLDRTCGSVSPTDKSSDGGEKSPTGKSKVNTVRECVYSRQIL